MSPEPDANATNATETVSESVTPIMANFAQRAVHSGNVNWRIWERALVMLWSVAVICGLSWALGLWSLNFEQSSARAAGPVPSIAGADISGRWTGQPMGYLDPAKVCGEKGCKLTLDIVRCGDNWCGLRVESQDKCGGVALTLKPHQEKDPAVTPVLDGKLELADGTQPYVIEAVYRAAVDGGAPQMTLVGDTGPELMMMRRSFPFRAVLARSGDAVCKLEKPAV